MNLLDRFVPQTAFSSYEDFVSNYQIRVPEKFNFAVDVVDAYASLCPDKLALRWFDDHGHSRDFSFADISRLSRQAAFYLKAQGIQKGDKVILILKRRWEYWVTAVALHRLGATLIPASFQLAQKDIVYRANAARAKMILCAADEWVVTQTENAKPYCETVEKIGLVGAQKEGWLPYGAAIEETKEQFICDPSIQNEDIMILYFTSGTTGMPKMVEHAFTYPLGHITTARYWQMVEDDGLHLTVSDSGWAKFGWGCIYGQWIAGTAIMGYDMDNKFNPASLIAAIRDKKPTTLCVPPTIYRYMMKNGFEKSDFASVHHCSTAGEPLSPEISRTFTEMTGLTIHEGFGQTESPVLVANFPFFSHRAGSMGKPNPQFHIVILDSDGEECQVGAEGEMCIKDLDKYVPPTLIRGYLTQEGQLKAYQDVYHTGDVVWRDEDGYLWFVGRNDDVIKCSGYRIGPFEIETILLSHPAVLECAITGAPDPLRGQVVKATIVLNKGYVGSDELTKEIQNYVKKATAPYKYPRIVEYVSELPKTTSGKVSRVVLRNKEEKK